MLGWFVASATVFSVAINDSYVEIAGGVVRVRFEAFFTARFPIDDIARVQVVDPHPRWRYRWGLSTNFADRIACSHGGPMVSITLARPQRTRLWPRHLPVTHFWLAVRQHDAFLATLERLAPSAFLDSASLLAEAA